MKRARFLLTTLVGALAACSSAFAIDPEWILNNGPDLDSISVGQGALSDEFNLARIDSVGTDCTVTPEMTQDHVFAAAERPFFALRYKYETTIAYAGLFFATEESPSFSDKNFSAFPIQGDGEWHNTIVDMREFPHKNWKGKIIHVRFDPTNPSDSKSKYYISRFGFFPTKEAAQAFLEAAKDAPDYSRATTILGDNQRCIIPGGVLKDSEYKREDFMIAKPFEPKTFKAKNMREDVVVVDENGKVLRLCDATSRGFATYCVTSKGKYAVRDLGDKKSPNDVVGLQTEPSVRFVLARNLMKTVNGKFLPEEKISEKEAAAIQKTLDELKVYGEIGEQVAACGSKLAGMTREEGAVTIAESVRKALGTSVASPYPAEYFTRERIRVGAWGNFRNLDFNDEYMRTYADCGFDFVLGMGTPSNELLAAGDKYGVEVFVNDGLYSKPLEGDAEYVDHPSYTGAYVTDEPGSDAYDRLAAVCNPYKELTGKEPYVNLLPMYANAAQLKYGAGAAAIEYYDADPDLFRKYCAAFCEKFNTYYICTDIYPFNWDKEHKKTTYADYVESINVIASVAREYDREFWCYIQTFAWIASKRTPTEAEFRWQCYSMLSFGCRCILCWTYAGYEDEFPSLVDTQSRKTTAWYDARPVLHELRRLSDEYVKYRNLGAFTHGCTDKTPYLKMSGEYKDFAAIKKVECDKPLLLGCFEKKDDTKKPAFTIVNMSEFQENVGATVRVELDATSATAWYRGVPQKVMPNDEGVFTFELASGEGVFVTLD